MVHIVVVVPCHVLLQCHPEVRFKAIELDFDSLGQLNISLHGEGQWLGEDGMGSYQTDEMR